MVGRATLLLASAALTLAFNIPTVRGEPPPGHVKSPTRP